MTLPSFLIVGSMKSGTTTLFEDLASHPVVYAPEDKEPGDLNHDAVLTPEGRAKYERHFRRCSADQLAFEASTYYTKMPEYQDSARRARSLLGSELKVIYIVREPIARTISQHRHMLDFNDAGPDINETVRTDTRLIDYSRYLYQIEPWLEALGEEQVMVLHFESYISNRVAIVEAVQSFLGMQPRGELISLESIANKSEGKLVHTGLSRFLSSNPLYRNWIRPNLPTGWKQRAKKLMTRPSTATPTRINAETVDLILEKTADDVSGIAPLLYPAVELGTLPWNMEEARMKALGHQG